MIRHILKIIWNERKTNSWIILEYVLVFCILWFCCDYLYYIGKSYYGPMGFDINNTYSIKMTDRNEKDIPELTEEDNYANTLTLMERIRQYPGIESVCISDGCSPYEGNVMGMGFLINNDSISQMITVRNVSSEFFDVFRIKLSKGKIFDWTDPANARHALISPDNDGNFGNLQKHPITEVNNLKYGRNNEYTIIGITEKYKSAFFKPYENNVFVPMEKWRISLHNSFEIRIHPNAAKGFEERFTRDMKEQLNVGAARFSSITSIKEMRKSAMKRSGITDNLNSVYSITSFLIINIFLGIIGTFWYRTVSRKSEVGLRIALGSSKRKIKTLLYTETIFLLLISAFIGVNICINLGQTDLLTTLGIPISNAEQIGSGIEQHFINFGLTFLFLAVISLLAVWYPVRQSSNMHPAEVLHEE